MRQWFQRQSRPRIHVQRVEPDYGLPEEAWNPLPYQAYEGDVGLDLFACLRGREDAPEPFRLEPQQYGAVPAGIRVAVDGPWFLAVVPRSGLAARKGVTVRNAPGVIDSDYTGEVKVVLQTAGDPVEIVHGNRIAQLVLMPAPDFAVDEVDDLPRSPTDRGAGGFGSSDL